MDTHNGGKAARRNSGSNFLNVRSPGKKEEYFLWIEKE